MYILAIETTGAFASVALVECGAAVDGQAAGGFGGGSFGGGSSFGGGAGGKF